MEDDYGLPVIGMKRKNAEGDNTQSAPKKKRGQGNISLIIRALLGEILVIELKNNTGIFPDVTKSLNMFYSSL